jgi:type IV secretory pathway TrbD component
MAQQTTKTGTAAARRAATRRPDLPPKAAGSAHELEAPLDAPHGRGPTIPVLTVGVRPVLTVGVRLMRLPTPRNLVSGAAPGAIRDRLPDRKHVLYYGGLGALAAFGVLSWPTAAVIGTGVWIAGRACANGQKHGEDEPAATPGEQ